MIQRSGELLNIKKLTVRFGGVSALSKVNLQVNEKEIVSIIGPNGAGKTTLFNALTGFVKPNSGKVMFKGYNLLGLKTHQIHAIGVSRTFQNIRLFPNMTAIDNLRVAFESKIRMKASWMVVMSMIPNSFLTRFGKEVIQKAKEILNLCKLEGKENILARNLSYGDQRRLELARALSSEPNLLLLDEPTAGMDPEESRQLVDLIKVLKDKISLSVLLIEHDMRVVMKISDRVAVIDYGKKIADSSPQLVQNNPLVIEAYLGKGEIND